MYSGLQINIAFQKPPKQVPIDLFFQINLLELAERCSAKEFLKNWFEYTYFPATYCKLAKKCL